MCFVLCLIYTWKDDNRFFICNYRKSYERSNSMSLISECYQSLLLYQSVTYLSANKERIISSYLIRIFSGTCREEIILTLQTFPLTLFFLSHSSSIQLPSSFASTFKMHPPPDFCSFTSITTTLIKCQFSLPRMTALVSVPRPCLHPCSLFSPW